MIVRRIPNWDGTAESTELYHHGIKGQRWGIRRYQNSDGSLKTAGYAHYGYGLKKEITNKGNEIQNKLSNIDIKSSIKEKASDVKETVSTKTTNFTNAITSEKAQKIAKVVLVASAVTLTAATVASLHRNKGIRFHKDLAYNKLYLQRIQDTPVIDKSHANYYFGAKNKMDKLKYQGTYGATRKFYYKADPHLVSATAENAKMASIKKSSEIFNKKYARDRKFRNAVNEGFDLAQKGDIGKLWGDKVLMKKAHKLANKKNLSKKEQMQLYDAFNATLTLGNKDHKQYDKFYKALKRRGYTGIWDTHDMHISPYRNKAPMIIFDHSKVTQTGARKLNNMELLGATMAGGSVIGGQYLIKEGAAATAALSGTVITAGAVKKRRHKYGSKKTARVERNKSNR